ncbi:hypothetical protein P3T75_10125 [Enterococcus montenegrensis]|uniref:hypothetical protein n=1 Tax=Enterococcus montenegrensis TaxID=3031993 RepID=UPI00249E774E|nr:hypothetical protein [Enterococcus montenegrensis]WHA08663.1 hypothetical protein P3T75_10125 [Enterococcus montenegrensis]
MKNKTKVTIGLSIAAVAGITTAVIASDAVINKIRHKKDRCKVKRFVDDKFDGNEKLMSVVNNLSDDELDSLMNVMKKIKSGRKQISVYGDSLKETTESLKDKLSGLIDQIV